MTTHPFRAGFPSPVRCCLWIAFCLALAGFACPLQAQSPHPAKTPAEASAKRTAALSTQPADQIAASAQSFGQEDDITVLTLTFAPGEVAHA